MKRSLIAMAALLLLLSSMTYANPPRPPRRAPRVRFWSVLACWLGHNHARGHERLAPRYEYGRIPPGHRGRPSPGWRFGWDNGRHNGRRYDNEHRGRPGPDRSHEGERSRGRG